MRLLLIYFTIFFPACNPGVETANMMEPPTTYPFISGIYPHLAMYNEEDSECGTGAVVVWANRLWAITYSAHKPFGSSDKLYEITAELQQKVRPESIGGTPANRMIHKESNQLFIGPYVIDGERNVRVVPPSMMPGRLTGTARHLTEPANKVYTASMEEGFYEIDVNTLQVLTLYEDSNPPEGSPHNPTDVNPPNATLLGAHGKGLYSGQGVLVYSNNGEAVPEAKTQFDIESGSLSEWDGEKWTMIRRNQFVEVSGPGGIYGNENSDADPIWTTGWDHKSIIVGSRDQGSWHFYRLPKASHSYDGAHGWNTEWPRIRNVGTEENPDYLMTMHGLFWGFPEAFSSMNSSGLRPRSAYLKVIGDFTRWNDNIVFACDDSAHKEFLNKRKVKGDIEGPGQSHSNLWFVAPDELAGFGPTHASGAVWLDEPISAGEYSEPFLFSGWTNRSVAIAHEASKSVSFTFEVDKKGDGVWSLLRVVEVMPGKPAFIAFSTEEAGEWVRVSASENTQATVHFSFSDSDTRPASPSAIFSGLADIEEENNFSGLLYALGENRKVLGMATDDGYYELTADLQLVKKADQAMEAFIENKFAIPKKVVVIDSSSVLITDDAGRRWRLPLGADEFTAPTNSAQLRLCREVATERDLFNCHGTFYELPAENADGFAKIRPISSHRFRIHDYASYRGMLVMTGLNKDLSLANKHVISSDENRAAVWLGVIDDLWKMGKPTGRGGPWKETSVQAEVPSDAYLFGFYDKRKLTLSHDLRTDVLFTIELEPIGHGPWMEYMEISVGPGVIENFEFPVGIEARWIRFRSDKVCVATAWLEYE